MNKPNKSIAYNSSTLLNNIIFKGALYKRS